MFLFNYFIDISEVWRLELYFHVVIYFHWFGWRMSSRQGQLFFYCLVFDWLLFCLFGRWLYSCFRLRFSWFFIFWFALKVKLAFVRTFGPVFWFDSHENKWWNQKWWKVNQLGALVIGRLSSHRHMKTYGLLDDD